MIKAKQLLEDLMKVDESWIGDLINYDKVNIREVDDNYVVTFAVKTASIQDTNRLAVVLGQKGLSVKRGTDNISVVVTVPKGDKDAIDLATKELNIDVTKPTGD